VDGILYALRTPLADGGKQVAVLDPATGTVDTNSGALVSSPAIVGSASQFFQGLAFEAPPPPPVVDVTIDIWPGLFPNLIVPGAPGVVLVAAMLNGQMTGGQSIRGNDSVKTVKAIRRVLTVY
jgi:hypothetical protein